VFSVQEGTIKVSGEEWGGLTSKDSYRDYHLTLEWKWGGPNLGKRAGHARDSGILVHGTGEDGAHGGTWLQSIESQIIEGGAGDFIMVEAGSSAATRIGKINSVIEVRKMSRNRWENGTARK
jgi:hypothetical protein